MKSRWIRVNIDTFDVDLIKDMEDWYFPAPKDWNIDTIIEAFKEVFHDYIRSDFEPVDEIDTTLEGVYYYFDEEVLIIEIDGKNVYISNIEPHEPFY